MNDRVLVVAPEGVDITTLQRELQDIGAEVRTWFYVGQVVAVDDKTGVWSDGPYTAAIMICRRLDEAGDAAELALTLGELEPAIDALQRSSSNAPVTLVVDHKGSVGTLNGLSIQGVNNVLSWSDSQVWHQAAVGVEKLIGDAPWGMDRYFQDSDTDVISHLIVSSRQRDVMLEELAQFLAPHNVNRRVVAAAQSVVDEFLINALYNAPVDAEGQRLFARQNRAVPVELNDSDAAWFRYAYDGKRLYLSVFDRFGSLDPETVRSYLIRGLRKGDDQIEYKEGGAGLGLYTVLESVTRFTVNIVPGCGTEMIGVLESLGSFRRFQSNPKSFQLFVGHTESIQPPSLPE